MVSLLASVVYIALYIFFLSLWGRFILDWVQVFARSWRPTGPLLVVAEAVYTVTDPPLRRVRQVIPPLRLGAVAIDLGWSIVMIGTLIVMGIVGSLR